MRLNDLIKIKVAHGEPNYLNVLARVVGFETVDQNPLVIVLMKQIDFLKARFPIYTDEVHILLPMYFCQKHNWTQELRTRTLMNTLDAFKRRVRRVRAANIIKRAYLRHTWAYPHGRSFCRLRNHYCFNSSLFYS